MIRATDRKCSGWQPKAVTVGLGICKWARGLQNKTLQWMYRWITLKFQLLGAPNREEPKESLLALANLSQLQEDTRQGKELPSSYQCLMKVTGCCILENPRSEELNQNARPIEQCQEVTMEYQRFRCSSRKMIHSLSNSAIEPLRSTELEGASLCIPRFMVTNSLKTTQFSLKVVAIETSWASRVVTWTLRI